MNYFREILACGQDGICGGGPRYGATLQKDDDHVWRELLLCHDDGPSLPPVPRYIRFNPSQIYEYDQEDATDDDDEGDNLVGLAFVGEPLDKTSFEAFMEMEEADSEDKSAQDMDIQLSVWSLESVSLHGKDDSYINWDYSPTGSHNEGSSYGTSSGKHNSSLLFPRNQNQNMLACHKKELSQGTMATASTWTTTAFDHGHGEI
jgi:hypothetical protein